MPIIVNSPFSGKPVKIRDQDIDRAVKDEEGRIFYVLTKSDGSGYYGSRTRQASDKDEQRYEKMAHSMAQAHQTGQVMSQAQLHDARGRRGRKGKLVILLFVILIAVLGLLVYKYKDKLPQGPAANNTPAQPPDRAADQ